MSCHVGESLFCFCSLNPGNTRTPPVSACLEAAPPPAPRLRQREPRRQDSLAPLQRGEGWGEGLGRLAAVDAHPAPHPNLLPAGGEKGRAAASAGDEGPENRAQGLEKVDSAPGIATAIDAAACPTPLRDASRCVAPRHEGGEVRSAASAGDERPENRAEVLEKVESTPGIATAVDGAACPSPLRHATRCVAPRHEGGEVRSAASAGDERPENRAEALEKVDSAPGIAAAVCVAACPSPLRDATRCVAPRHEGGVVRSAASAGEERPENRAQVLEKVEFRARDCHRRRRRRLPEPASRRDALRRASA